MNELKTKHNYTLEEIKQIYEKPLLELISIASEIHRKHHNFTRIHKNTLISYKTGGCPEDCKYCAQSSFYKTHIDSKAKYLTLEEFKELAEKAKNNGAERICISASWSGVPNNENHLMTIIEMGKIVKKMGMEVCCTLGSLNSEQLQKLKKTGFSAYNHNLDTSADYYPNITTTRTYEDRLKTLQLLQENHMPYCSGGIIGLGESEIDRLKMLQTLANQPEHPYSVPLNIITPIKGTPLENAKVPSHWEMIRLIATTRIIMPETIICLAAGRQTLNYEAQALCFLAGANSVFIGEKLLTTSNCNIEEDKQLFKILNLE